MRTFWFAAVFLNSLSLHGQNPPWANSELDFTVFEVLAPSELVDPIQQAPQPFAAQSMLLSVPASIDAEFTELAVALNNDAVEIFNYVRNHIDYEHYHGSRKGAKLTLLEGSGNDFDQCALLGELLKAAGHTNILYDARAVSIDYVDIINWWGLAEEPYVGETFEEAVGYTKAQYFGQYATGLSDLVAKQAAHAVNFASKRGSMRGFGNNVVINAGTLPEKASIIYDRMVLEYTTTGGTTYVLDPAYKEYEIFDNVSNLLGEMGYNKSQILQVAGGNSTADYSLGLSESAIQGYLADRTMDLLSFLKQNEYQASVAEIIGGRRIIVDDISNLSEANPLTNAAYSSFKGATINGLFLSTISFQVGASNYSIPLSELDGRKISLSSTSDLVVMRFDEEAPFLTETITANDFTLSVSVSHPGSLGVSSETKKYQKSDDDVYAIIYGFSPSGRLLQKRNEQLNEFLEDGYADDSDEVRSELLNVMGLIWLYQVTLSNKLMSDINDTSYLLHHSIGRMAQEEGFYIDVGLVYSGVYPRSGLSDLNGFEATFHFGALLASAMEHGIIEQLQSNVSAVSTVNILREANNSGQRLYLCNSSNWNSVKTQLVNYDSMNGVYDDTEPYTDSNTNGKYDLGEPFTDQTLKQHFEVKINNGTQIFLPKNSAVIPDLPNGDPGNWTGSGWIRRSASEAGMIIQGGYSGGYSYWPGLFDLEVNSNTIVGSAYTNPVYAYTPSSISAFAPLPTSGLNNTFYGSDPVDMRTGAFVYAHVDLQTGTESAPRGLSFSRNYSSENADSDNQGLGYGWTHQMYVRAAARTAVEESLGLGTIEQFSAWLTTVLIGSDLYRSDGSPKDWGVAVHTVGWFTDQMTNNAVSIVIGKDRFQFIRQPDGSYEPPAGSTMELTEINGDFVLENRLGNTFYFEDTEYIENTDQRLARIVDVDGKEMTFNYYADDRLDFVQDAYTRTYTFGYDGDRINLITDSTGRDVHYRYDAAGNLDRYTDPEDKSTYFIYEATNDPNGAAPTDPSATEASEHRMVRMRNHDKEIIAQNVWDDLGRVKEQYLHGDTAKSWKLRYTGTANFEENPNGDVTIYYYDKRGRPSGKEDPLGNRSYMVYDGQDQVVETTTSEDETTVYHYDVDHNLVQVDYPRGGGSTINHYDSFHRLDDTTDPESNVVDLIYFDTGFHADKNRPWKVIDEEGTTIFTYYDSGAGAGRVFTKTDDDGLQFEKAYDAYGQLDWSESPGDFKTDFSYTARGDLDYVDSPSTIRTDFAYNERRQVTQVVYDYGGADEATEDRTYDNQGRLYTVTAPEDNNGQRALKTFTYTPTDLLDAVALVNETASSEDDIISEVDYDGRDWKTLQTDALLREVEFIYFADGQLDELKRPENRDSSYTYDGDNRMLSSTVPGAPNNRISGYAYGITSTTEGDETGGYPRSVFTDALNHDATSEFNRNGQLRYYTNTRNEVFEFRYDGLKRRTHTITPLDADNSRSRSVQYNHRGEAELITEPSAQTATYVYDQVTGRLDSVTYTDGSTTEIVNYDEYDNNGNLKEMSEGSEVISRTYDNLDRVKSYTDINSNEIGYRYYPSGKLAKIIYPGGSENGVGHVEYTYWKTGRLKEVIDKLDSITAPRITTTYWNNDGNLDRIERPNGTERKVKYDAAGRPWIVEEYTSTGKLIALYKNEYFQSDEIKSVYQLPKPHTSSAKPNVVDTMLHNADNQLSSFEGQSVTHDPDGNMTFGPLPDGTLASYGYDIRNRLETAGGLTYGYDPEGERISVSGTGLDISYVTENNQGLGKVIQRTKNGETVRYVWGVGLLYEVNTAEVATYYHYDNYGNTIALTNESETVIDRLEYSPYGGIIYREANFDTPFLFSGFFGIQTDDNGLFYVRARYFNPLIRRFINADPAQDGWNWYAYAAGNPINFVDPTGLGTASTISAMNSGLESLGMAQTIVGSALNSTAFSSYANSLSHVDRGRLMVVTIPKDDILTDYMFAALTGARDGLQKHVSFSAEGAAIIPLMSNGLGLGPAGSLEANLNGDIDFDVGAAGGFGAGAATGITFRGQPFSESAVQSISLTGGTGPGGSLTLEFNERWEVVNFSLTLGFGYGFDASYFLQLND